MLDANKTAYAPKIARKLCEFEVDKMPKKINEFFGKIKAGVEL
jgi:hypothetical protein